MLPSVTKKAVQSKLTNFVAYVNVNHELDNNNKYVKTLTTNAITNEIVNTFPVYKSTKWISVINERK